AGAPSAATRSRDDRLGRCPGVPRRCPGGLDASRGAGARAEPTDHRSPVSRVRDQFWRTDFVRPPARGVAPQRGRRAAGCSGGERRRGGAEVGAAARGGLPGAGGEGAGLRLERRRAAASPELSGTVRVSTGECAAGFLARCLSGPTTTALPSGITLELVDSRQTANLARREADMALRHQPPETGDFYISKAGTFACAVYRRRGADAGAWVT